MHQTTGVREPVHLHFLNNGKVLITPEDSGRFKMAARRAVRVLHREKVIDEAITKFQNEYLPRLHKWCQENKDLVRACYLGTPEPHGLPVFVLGATAKYSFELGERISALALQLEEDGWSSHIVQISDGGEEDILTFFNPESALQIYAQSKTAPGEGGRQPNFPGFD